MWVEIIASVVGSILVFLASFFFTRQKVLISRLQKLHADVVEAYKDGVLDDGEREVIIKDVLGVLASLLPAVKCASC